MQTYGLFLFLWSSAVWGPAQFAERPKATLRMTTQEKLFHFGDTVNLECSIEGDLTNWTFRWFFGNQTEKGKQIKDKTEDNYNIPYVTESNSGVYRCDAYVAGSYNSSQTSNVITLRIQERPNAILILRNQEKLISIGDTVTLDCSIDGGFTGWQYRWYKFGSSNDWEKFIEFSGSTYTIKSISHSDNGEYLCDAINETPPCGSQASNTITVNVKGVGVGYATVNGIRYGISSLVLIVLLIILIECFWHKLHSICRPTEDVCSPGPQDSDIYLNM